MKDLDSLSNFASFFLSTPAAIHNLETIFELVDDAARRIVREGIWFLEEYISDGYGESLPSPFASFQSRDQRKEHPPI